MGRNQVRDYNDKNTLMFNSQSRRKGEESGVFYQPCENGPQCGTPWMVQRGVDGLACGHIGIRTSWCCVPGQGHKRGRTEARSQ